MHHFFVSASQIDHQSNTVKITNGDVHHMRKVLRLTAGDHVSISDGSATRYTAVIRELNPESVMLEILTTNAADMDQAGLPVTLVQGVAKGSKMEWIVQKTTEMGINAIKPVMTEFTVVRYASLSDAQKKRDRWQKIAEEASKQSKRLSVPFVHTPESFSNHMRYTHEDKTKTLRLLAHEKTAGLKLSNYLTPENLGKYQQIEIWVGPEGGFSEEEVELACQSGVNLVGLGPRILRTETAGLVLLSIILYEMGVLEGSF
jgi:16S rRNA (uracil1498-N3)-methyltransferase